MLRTRCCCQAPDPWLQLRTRIGSTLPLAQLSCLGHRTLTGVVAVGVTTGDDGK